MPLVDLKVLFKISNINCAFEIYYRIEMFKGAWFLWFNPYLRMLFHQLSAEQCNVIQVAQRQCKHESLSLNLNISCYTVYQFPFCTIRHTCLHTVMIFIRNHDCEELKTVSVGFVG